MYNKGCLCKKAKKKAFKNAWLICERQRKIVTLQN